MAKQFTREARYWFNLDKRGDDECWGWRGATSRGYARLGNEYAHRFSYETHVGPIPDGMELDHLCGTRACTNWRHLEPVTHAENMARGVSRRAINVNNNSSARRKYYSAQCYALHNEERR